MKVTSIFLIAQTNEIFEEKNVKGVIFSKDYINKAHNWLDNSYRFTPTREEIKAFEKNLKLDLKRINTNRWNQKGSCPIIHKNLKKGYLTLIKSVYQLLIIFFKSCFFVMNKKVIS